MTETVGRRSLVMPLLSVAGVVMLVLVIKSLVVHLAELFSSVFGGLFCYLIEGIVLLVVVSILFHILPVAIGKALTVLLSSLLSVVGFVLSMILRFLKVLIIGGEKSRGAR
jgi:hypothetical protein